MNEDKIGSLINRAKKVDCYDSLNNSALEKVEKELGVILPNDFKKISEYCNYELLNQFDFFSFGLENNNSVIKETLNYRANIGFPFRYIALYEDDAGAIIMETQPSPELYTPIIWCAIEDIYNLCENRPLIYNPKIFPSFTDFFEYLIAKEEKEREVNSKKN